ncbi:hypothetical protein CYMTET_27904 [Cymbomonas tetramitiformis]|uniref:Uncharacterized protein n=1 Tax=Cymbomonas tetramitiformis TaxID=36881 RepID=A0AAE0KWG4_9CHLO|nr:hypothetical protein CYMTET_27904 [Cymbomonas tetramitiformis]
MFDTAYLCVAKTPRDKGSNILPHRGGAASLFYFKLAESRPLPNHAPSFGDLALQLARTKKNSWVGTFGQANIEGVVSKHTTKYGGVNKDIPRISFDRTSHTDLYTAKRDRDRLWDEAGDRGVGKIKYTISEWGTLVEETVDAKDLERASKAELSSAQQELMNDLLEESKDRQEEGTGTDTQQEPQSKRDRMKQLAEDEMRELWGEGDSDNTGINTELLAV